MKYPEKRGYHSSVLLNSPSGPKLLVIGGSRHFSCIADCWTLDIKKIIWNEVIITSTVYRIGDIFRGVKISQIGQK